MIRKYKEEIAKIYEILQEKSKSELKSRKDEIEKVLPEVISIEKKIAKLCIDVSINTLKHMDNRDNYLHELKNTITDLKMKKSELLVEKGYPMDYLNLHFQCSKCNDTGFIGATRCDCYKKHLADIYYKNSDLKDSLSENNFKNFNLNLYRDNRGNNEPESPRQNMKKILSKATNFINTFYSTGENLFFYGGSGTGKTFLSYCIAKELLDKGYLVIYKTADELIKNLNEIRFHGNKELEESILNCDLLIIDDLGTEHKTDISRSELFNLINKKLLKNKSMLISSNYQLEYLMENYSERITSRLLGNFTICKFYGEDIRIRNNLTKLID
ncbi:ATP-binding protein [Hathewaya histolytica]|uniref:ATP-binding protein n=1 Tax=Hathewaya histolytica TaxID=1498 RepID=UPI003B672EED